MDGSGDGSGPELFGRVAGLVRLANGTVVVADAEALELFRRLMSAAHTAGRRGTGARGQSSYPISRI